MKKTIVSLCLILVILASLISCGSGSTTTTPAETSETPTGTKAEAQYKDNVEFSTFFEGAVSAVDLGELTVVSVSALSAKLMPGIKTLITDSALCDAYELRYTAGASFDEFGVFHLTAGSDPQTAVEACKTYIKSKADDDLYRSYFPEEEYKLDEGEVRVFGNYVAYAILSKENRASFFAKIEELLKA